MDPQNLMNTNPNLDQFYQIDFKPSCLGSDLKNMIFLRKKTQKFVGNLCISLHFIPLDPDLYAKAQINAVISNFGPSVDYVESECLQLYLNKGTLYKQ